MSGETFFNISSEQSYSQYAEHFITLCSRALQNKRGLEGCPVVDMCARVEDGIYNKAMFTSGDPPTLWHSETAPIFYREMCEVAILCLENNNDNVDWKKLYNDSKKNIDPIYNFIMSGSSQTAGHAGGGKNKKSLYAGSSKFNIISKKTTKASTAGSKPHFHLSGPSGVGSTYNTNSSLNLTLNLSHNKNNNISNSSYNNSINNNSMNHSTSNSNLVDQSSSAIEKGILELNEMEVERENEEFEPPSPVFNRYSNNNKNSNNEQHFYANSNNNSNSNNNISSNNLQQQQQEALDAAREEARRKREEALNVVIDTSLLNLDDDDGFF